jgi:L-threonylcarbamoyladenylate synthase
MPKHVVALSLIREASVPIAASSVNLFGHLSPTTAQQVREQIGSEIDMILDGGRTRVEIESTIVHVVGGKVRIYRCGGLELEKREEVVGKVEICTLSERPLSPGQFKRHYAPSTLSR